MVDIGIGTTGNRKQSMDQNQHDLGYLFYEPAYPEAPGSSKLVVNIYNEPTCEHYDPDEVIFPTVNEDGGFEQVLINHPWANVRQFRVSIGRIRLRDRFDKRVLIFTFGGEVGIEVTDKKTVCCITSTAPILLIDHYASFQRVIAEEVEIMLAKNAAQKLPHIDEYYTWIASLEPWEFYVRSLVEIHEKFARFPNQSLPSIERLDNYLDDQIEIIHTMGRWPGSALRVGQMIPS